MLCNVLVMKLAPILINFYQNNWRISTAQDMLNDINHNMDLLKAVIIFDETVYGYKIVIKAQCFQWNLP